MLELNDNNNDECGICKQIVGMRIITKCKHIFHMKCFESYLGNYTTCPVCQASIENPYNEQHEKLWEYLIKVKAPPRKEFYRNYNERRNSQLPKPFCGDQAPEGQTIGVIKHSDYNSI